MAADPRASNLSDTEHLSVTEHLSDTEHLSHMEPLSHMEHLSSDYASSLLTSLHNQLKTKVFCDVALHLSDRSFLAHKNILAAASPYFLAMFTGGLSESGERDIHVQGTSGDIFEMLLEFMYTGDINITEETCQDLLAAADMFGLSGVVEACCLFLQKQLHPSNCLGIYQLSESHSCVHLHTVTEDYIHSHLLEVIKEDEFLSLDKDIFLRFLMSEHVHIDTEIDMLGAVLTWINHDIIGRRTIIFELLTAIRFPLIPKSSLETSIESCTDLSLKIAVRKTAQDFNKPRKSDYMEKLRRSHPALFQCRTGARRRFMILGGQQKDLGSHWNDSKTLSSVEIFDSESMDHSMARPMKYERSAHATVLANGMVYVLGGEKDSLILDSVECYDPAENRWSDAPCMLEPRCGLGAATVDDCIYAVGGWVGSHIGHTLEMYDPQISKWTVVDRMRTLRYHMGVLAYESLIYIVGGIGDMEQEERTTESYNPVTHEWRRLADMITPRSHMGTCVSRDMIYTVGGSTGDGPNGVVEVYDILTDVWHHFTMMPSPCAGPSTTLYNNTLYVFGGRMSIDKGSYSERFTVKTVCEFDLAQKEWLNVASLSSGRGDSAVIML